MSKFRITLISGVTYDVDAESGSKIQQSLIGNGPQAFEVQLDGKPVFLNTAAVALVEVVDATDAPVIA